MAFKSFFEEPEAEVARLAQAPVGSKAHTLSTLPVNIRGDLTDLMIELPKDTFHDHTIVVVPWERYPLTETERNEPFPRRRYRSTWRCIVVASNHPSYPVAGHRLAVSEDELVRGTLRTFQVPEAPVAEGAAA